MQAVILAGGLGTRLEPFTKIIPKPLLPIGESSVLEIQVLSLKKSGFQEIFIATNYMGKYVKAFLGKGKKYGVKITFSEEKKPLGTCGPVTLLKNQLEKPFILINGDILTTLDFGKFYKRAKRITANLTVATKQLVTPFEFGDVISKGNYVTRIKEKPNLKFEILAGVYFLKPAIFEMIPTNTYFGIDMLIRQMLKKKMLIGKLLIQDYWLDIGRANDYQTAQKSYNKYFKNLK